MKAPRSWYPGRFLLIALCGVLTGYLVAVVFCQSRPAVYRSSVLVAEPGLHSYKEVPLAPLHAELIRRDYEDERQTTLEIPGGDLCRAVTFRASKYGVEVEVLSDDPKKGIDLAVRAAALFRGMEHELELTAVDSTTFLPFTKGEHEDRMDAIQLRNLLNEDAKAVGFPDAFAVRERSVAGETEAMMELRKSEVFRRRWAMFEELATRIGIDGVPGDPLTAPPAILARCMEDYGFTYAEVDRWLYLGLGLGLAGGLGAAFFLARRKADAAGEEKPGIPAAAVVDW